MSGQISERADRFVRTVFRNRGGRPAPADGKEQQKVRDQRERLMKAREAAIKGRKGT